MPMKASDIEQLIKQHIPDAQVTIRDLAGDGGDYSATVSQKVFAANPESSSIRLSIRP